MALNEISVHCPLERILFSQPISTRIMYYLWLYTMQIAEDTESSIDSRVETGSGHLGHPGHIFSGSSGFDPD